MRLQPIHTWSTLISRSSLLPCYIQVQQEILEKRRGEKKAALEAVKKFRKGVHLLGAGLWIVTAFRVVSTMPNTGLTVQSPLSNSSR